MNPIFTLQYSEYKVAEELKKAIKGATVWVPTSAQEKGIDLLLYKHVHDANKVVTIQVKSSRAYKSKKYNNYFWLNRFEPNPNADFFIMIGTYADRHESEDDFKRKDIQWKDIILVYTQEEIKELFKNIAVTKKDEKPDNMWAFAFNTLNHIYIARGKYEDKKEITGHLLSNRISMIEEKLK